MNIRKNAVAGRFYPEKKEELEKFFNYFYEVEKQHLKTKLYKYELIGGIVPHAGYIYSGRITYWIVNTFLYNFYSVIFVRRYSTGVMYSKVL